MSKSVWEAYALFVKENAGYMKICCLLQWKQKKSHTCKEGRAHLRISVSHLLMNLKNNYLWKKPLLSGPIKNLRILIFTMLHLKNEENCCRYHHFILMYQKPQSYETQKFLLLWTIFSSLTPLPLTTLKIKILKNWKMHLEMSSLYTCVPKITIIWCELPEIWCITDWIFSHFWPSFALLPLPLPTSPENHNLEKTKRRSGYITILHKCIISSNDMYGSWDMKCNRQNILSFWVIFCPFTPLTTQLSKNDKKTCRDIIIFHKCT